MASRRAGPTVWEADGSTRFDRTADARPTCSRSTRRRPPSAARCTSATCSATPTPTRSPATSACAASRSSTRWVGTTTACRPSGACRTTTASAAIRASRTSRASSPPFRGEPPKNHHAVADQPAELPRALRRAGRDRREGLRGAAPPARPVGRLDADCTPRSTSARSRASQRAFLRNLAPGRGVQPGSADDVGHRLPHRRRPGRDGGPRAAGRLPQDRLPTATDGDGAIEIDTTRPELLAACVALVAHPDDERYQPLFGTTVRTPLYGVEVPVLAHELAQPDKGTGIAMICTFGDTTDVTWWRELNLPTPGDHRTRRAHPRRRPGRRRRRPRTPRSPA